MNAPTRYASIHIAMPRNAILERVWTCVLVVVQWVVVLLCLFWPAMSHGATGLYGAEDKVEWRIRFMEAAVVQGDKVLLHEVAVPVGSMPENLWREMANRELWPSPQANGKPVNMTRPRLQEAVVATMNDLAPYCLFPGSMALQRGGAVMDKEAVQAHVVNTLTPMVAGMPGETSLRDFRLPQYIFLKHAGQTVAVEPQKDIAPGRLSMRLSVMEMDGTVVQKYSGTAFLDVWAMVPAAATMLQKDALLEASNVTHIRANLAYLSGTPWDGRGGPWRLARAITPQEVIYQSDLGHIPTVRKGTVVTLIYQSQTVRMSVQAEALSDGVAGEAIPVRNLQSKKEVYATIQDGLTVLITGHIR